MSRLAVLGILRDALKITRAAWTLQEALRLVSLEHVAAVLAYALGQRIGELSPWGAGAVVRRLTDPDLAGLAPEEGWATPHPDWSIAHERQLRDAGRERERLVKVQQLQEAEAKRVAELATREQLELDFGGVVDRVEQTAPERLWSIVRARGAERAVRSNPQGLRGKSVRMWLLRAAEAGELI